MTPNKPTEPAVPADTRSDLSNDLFEVIAFMAVSAHKLLDEPATYGPFRLVDAASRLVEVMQDHGLSSEALDRIQVEIEEGKTSAMSSDAEFRGFLAQLVESVVREIKSTL